MSHDNLTKVLAASVIVAVVAIIVLLATTTMYAEHLSDDRKADQIAACVRANQIRSYINDILVEQHIALPPISIPVCSDIIK